MNAPVLQASPFFVHSLLLGHFLKALIHRPARVRAKIAGMTQGTDGVAGKHVLADVTEQSLLLKHELRWTLLDQLGFQAVHSTRTRQVSTMRLRKGRAVPADSLSC